MSKHIQLRRNLFYARLSVPPKLRPHFNGKRELIKSLETSDKRLAELKALKVIGNWKLEFESLKGNPDAIEKLAIEIRTLPDEGKDSVTGMTGKEFLIEDSAEKINDNNPSLVPKFYAVAYGRKTPFLIYLDEFLKQWNTGQKTKDMARSVIKKISQTFETIETTTRPQVLLHISRDQSSIPTKIKNYGFIRQYWDYLVNMGVIPSEPTNPFNNLNLKTKNKSNNTNRLSFLNTDIPKLLNEALKRKDQKLVDLIKLAAYTGARIEELCSLKLKNIKDTNGIVCFEIEDAKTQAGNRLVPIHPNISELVTNLISTSKDGYLLSDLSFNKYGNRSNAIGKRFGRLKKDLGFDERFVFHSIRKTVITTFENLDVIEGLTADIVGHEKKTMTYGLYSSGYSIEKKLEAIKKLNY